MAHHYCPERWRTLRLGRVAINARLLRIFRGADTTTAMPHDKESIDAKKQIAQRAYNLYEQHGHTNGHAKQDWLQAERKNQYDGNQK